MIVGDFLKALGQLGDPRFRRVLWRGIGLTLALLVGVYALMLLALQMFAPDSVTLPLIGDVPGISTLLSGASILIMLVLSVVLMVPVASAFCGLFLEEVAAAVEDRHYPSLPPATAQTFGQTAIDSINFFGLVVGANIVGLVLYIFSGPFAPLVFWVLNGFLLGREYFHMAATRRLGRDGARALRRRHSGQIWLAGTLMAAPLSIPVVNLLVPILGAATFTHLFHRLQDQHRG